MRKYLWFLLCLIVCWGCEPPGAQVLTGLIQHQDAMLRIIRENQTDPEIAKEKLTAYRDDHAHEYARLIQELQAVSAENMENQYFAEKLHEFTSKNYELVKTASRIGIDAAF
ncbi:MAG: hypothetical protein JW822_10915 [Spirochaetales bacterium]|nr:hypothetical protein [Spirochaetales bacterium]